MFSNRPLKKVFSLWSLFLVVSVCLCGSVVHAETVLNKIVAFVNGEIITQFDLEQAVGPDLMRSGLSRNNPAHQDQVAALEKRMLDTLITDQLFLQEAEKYKVEVKDSEVENEVRKMAQRNNMTLEQAKEQMRADGVSFDAFKETIRRSILRSRLISFMVSRKVVVTKEDIQAYYDEHKSEYSSDRKVTVKMLIFAPDADTGKVLSLLHDDKLAFEDAVKMYSVGPAKDNGGLLGDLSWIDLSEAWRSAIEPLAEGQISEMLEQDGRKILLKLDKKISGDVLPLDKVADTIESTLRKPMMEARFEEYSSKLREKAVIKINL